NDTGAGSSVMFRDANGFTVGQVTASGIFASNATGVTTAGNGDIDLVSTSGPITLAQAVNAGSGTVRINAGGAVAQTAGGAGVITAQNLVVRAAGNVDLAQLANNVSGNFAALDSAAGAFVRFLDSSGFTVNTVAGDACAQGQTGIFTNGDLSLRSTGGPLSIVQPINAGNGTVRLRSPPAV